MPRFLALTSKGLEPTLKKEMENLGFKGIEPSGSGFLFQGNWKECYRANLQLKTAARVLLTILDFPAYKPDELYHNILKHDFTKYIEPHGTLSVNASVSDSAFKDQRFVALKVKDAIVDQFRNEFGFRPNVEKENPQLEVYVRAKKNQFSVSIDTTGVSLSQRGYRSHTVEAPLREHLAAGLLQITSWSGETPLIDPFCGSGTFLIEAALQEKKHTPKREYAFENHKIFQKEKWDQLKSEVSKEVIEKPNLQLFGFDKNNHALLNAQANAKKAGVSEFIKFKNRDFMNIQPPADNGILIMNPPFGVRLDDIQSLLPVYKNLASKMKKEFKGWDMWILSGHPELSAALKLKADEKHMVYNGNLECRFLKYEIR